MVKPILLPVILLGLTMTACSLLSPFEPTPNPTSGVEGTVTLGPMCPGPVRVGQNTCPDQPYQATIIVLDANNQEIAKTQSDVSGKFIIPLSPGTYTLHPVPGKPFPIARDQTVVVTEGPYSQVTIQFDTGMR